MEKYIYKITNLINNKIYIGQTKNVKNRWYEHCLDSTVNKDNNYLHNAMHKYGINNFKIEIIEGPISNYNEREIYWINYYNSYNNKSKGYNMTPGGENPPILKGEESKFATYSNQDILKIQHALIDNKISFQEISNKYNISLNYLYMINQGRARHNDEFTYPLRINGNERKSEPLINEISYYLLYTTDSIEQIARTCQVDSNLIYKVNKGQHYYCNKSLAYPLRAPYSRLSNYLLNNIYLDLLDNKLKFSEIEKKYNLSKSTINNINQGKRYKKDNYSYPLRPSDKRVYN